MRECPLSCTLILCGFLDCDSVALLLHINCLSGSLLSQLIGLVIELNVGMARGPDEVALQVTMCEAYLL